MTIRAVIVFIVVVAAPLMPLVSSWRRVLNKGGVETVSTMRIWVELALVTFSFLLLLCSLIWNSILGPAYSWARLGGIYASILLMTLIAIDSAFGNSQLKSLLAITAIILAFEWAYMAIVNSVV